MNRAYILIGSNLDRRNNYLEALRRLQSLGHICSISSVYETQAVGNRAAPDYYNGVVLLKTELRAHILKHALRQIEVDMGRTWSSDRNASRPIDLDIVLFNHDQIKDGELSVPDPLILKRPFIAIALAELSPDYLYPGADQTLAQIANRFGTHPANTKVDPVMTRDAKAALEIDAQMTMHVMAGR